MHPNTVTPPNVVRGVSSSCATPSLRPKAVRNRRRDARRQFERAGSEAHTAGGTLSHVTRTTSGPSVVLRRHDTKSASSLSARQFGLSYCDCGNIGTQVSDR